jgi:hypothetical protein
MNLFLPIDPYRYGHRFCDPFAIHPLEDRFPPHMIIANYVHEYAMRSIELIAQEMELNLAMRESIGVIRIVIGTVGLICDSKRRPFYFGQIAKGILVLNTTPLMLQFLIGWNFMVYFFRIDEIAQEHRLNGEIELMY